MEKLMEALLILNGDHDGCTFRATEDTNSTVYLYGVRVCIDTAPTTSEELEIIYESDVQSNRNKHLYSKDMKSEVELSLEFDNPIELRENERFRVRYPNTDRNIIRVYPSHQFLFNG